MSADALAAALQARGLSCAIETHGTVAVLIPRDGVSAWSGSEQRELAVRLAREHGFTHVALELQPAADGA